MTASLESVLGSKEASLALLQVLADNSFDAVLITDASLEGKITYANKAFKRLTGYDPSDVIGKTPRILQGAGTDKKVIERLAGALKPAADLKARRSITKRMVRPSSCAGGCCRLGSARQSRRGWPSNGRAPSFSFRSQYPPKETCEQKERTTESRSLIDF